MEITLSWSSDNGKRVEARTERQQVGFETVTWSANSHHQVPDEWCVDAHRISTRLSAEFGPHVDAGGMIHLGMHEAQPGENISLTMNEFANILCFLKPIARGCGM
jgi:hypothetical protein